MLILILQMTQQARGGCLTCPWLAQLGSGRAWTQADVCVSNNPSTVSPSLPGGNLQSTLNS